MRSRTFFVATLIVLFAAVTFFAGYALASMQPYPEHEASWNELVARGLIDGDADYYSMGFATEQEYYHALATAILAVDDKVGSSFRPIVPLPTSTTTTLPPTTAPSTTSTVVPSSTTTSSSTTTTTSTPTTTTTSTPDTTTSTTVLPTTSSTSTTTTTAPPATTTTTTTTTMPDVPAVDWVVGEKWQWVLSGGTIDIVSGATVYGFDGNEHSAETVAAIEATGAKTICYVSAGSWEDWRPDADSYPDEVKGNDNGWPGEKYVDIRQWDILGPILDARTAECADKGFDAMEYDNVDTYTADTGFPLTASDQITFNRNLAALAQNHGLAVGLKNDVDQLSTLEPFFDFAINEECLEWDECDAYSVFIDNDKPVYHAEYSGTIEDICANSPDGFSNIKKRLDLGNWVEHCPTTLPPTTTTTTTLPPSTTTTTTTTTIPPSGPTVTIAAGIHENWSVEVMENTSYLCEDGAILDGGGTTRYAFYGTADNVTIDGCEIRNYDNPAQFGAINAAKQTVDDADGWTITNNEIHHNWGAGIYLSGKDFVIANNHIHHQHQLGIAVNTGPGLIENNEIAWNNYEVDYNWGWEAGGTKFWATDGLIVRGNYSHDNHGPGLWDDYDNVNILYEDNIVEDNYGPGIFHEIGYTAIIRNNEVRRNGFGHDVWVWGPGISIASSQDTEVYGNIVEGNYNAITLVDQCRGVGDFDFNGQEWHSKNNYIHDNTIINSGLTGGATDCGYEEMFDPGVNVFENNTYTNGRWAWDHATRSWSEWLGYHPNDGP